MRSRRIKVLVVDDSALVRKVLSRGLSMDPEIEVIGVAQDPFDARDKIAALKPDVMTLDVEMPKMDGVEFLRRLMAQLPIPTIIVSSLTERGTHTAVAALAAGAVEVVAKPKANVAGGLDAMMRDLRVKVKQASFARLQKLDYRSTAVAPDAGRSAAGVSKASQPGRAALVESSHLVITIGASTGGTQALAEVIRKLPATTPGIVIVQHMPPSFTGPFAKRLNELGPLRVAEARDGDRIMDGLALVAPGGKQLRVVQRGAHYYVSVGGAELVSGHCPSVNVMMSSAASVLGGHAIAVMLTGMGDDGADGMLALRLSGARTIGQDERTSTVYGMPRVAFERGAVEVQLPLSQISGAIDRLVRNSSHHWS